MNYKQLSLSLSHVFVDTHAYCPKIRVGGGRAAGEGQTPKLWVAEALCLHLHSSGPGCRQTLLLCKDPSRSGRVCNGITLSRLAQKTGALVWGGRNMCVHMKRSALAPTSQPCSWVSCPRTSLISDLLTCMMPFQGLGIEPSCSAQPCSILQGPCVGIHPGEPASCSVRLRGETWSPYPPLCKCFRVWLLQAPSDLSRAPGAATCTPYHLPTMPNLAVTLSALVSPAEPHCPCSRGQKACTWAKGPKVHWTVGKTPDHHLRTLSQNGKFTRTPFLSLWGSPRERHCTDI